METVTREQVAAVVTSLAEVTRQSMSTAGYQGFWNALSDLSPTQLNDAYQQALRSSRFMPTPAELREFAGIPSTDDRAVAAWGIVLSKVHLGPYKHVSFVDDRICNAVIRQLGGWPTFISRFTGGEQEKWIRKEFIDAYRSLHRQNIDGDLCRPLPGLAGGTLPNGDEYHPPVIEITTGLPPLPVRHERERNLPTITGATRRSDIPRVELKKP